MEENREARFAEALAETLKLARKQKNRLSGQQIDDAFSYLALDKKKMEQVHAYFREHKVTISDEEFLASAASEADGAYASGLSFPEREELFAGVLDQNADARSRFIEAYLPMVEDIARLYEEQGVLRDDLIGEGNVALVEGCFLLQACETLAEAEGALSSFVMNAMEDLIKRTMQDIADDEKTLSRVNDTAEKAKKLKEEYHRDLTVPEFLDETGYTLEELSDVLRLTGWQMEGLETGHE